MTNTAKNSAATPKTVKEAVENKVEETTVPAQATGGKTVKEDQLDKVLDNEAKVLFSGTPDEVRAWLNERPSMIYAVRKTNQDGLIISTMYVEEGPLKLSLVQRAKAAAEKLKQNKKALAILGGALVVAGLTIKNNRKTTAEPEVEEDVVEETTEIPNPDDNTDSL